MLHDEEGDAVLLADVVEGADVGVAQAREDAGLGAEALEALAVLCVRGQDLDGDGAVEARVAGAVHLAHASRSEGRNDLVRAEARAGAERHVRMR